MGIPSNRPLVEILVMGVANKNVLDDYSFHPKKYFKNSPVFCNESIIVKLPPNALDVEGWKALDPNDPTRTRIHRDCELLFL